ncbi:CamS family sex pheromone protein [Shouchella patagoniensis]|uniref:CamS family sex pheromone protein n=1 Tax=Shouchella patagoniensis TaxID=228576 RepID=UPI000994C893|nr:CamS family sex pheromone protein [Shouchella patagoniensis]
MKRWGIIGFSLLVLAGCNLFGDGQDEGPEQAPDVSEVDDSLSVVPSIPSEENYYSNVLREGSYIHGETRGYGLDLGMSRKDLDWLELGLEDIAKDTFSPDSHYFQEGEHLTRDTLRSWIRRYEEPTDDNPGNPGGLNPPLGEGEDDFEKNKNSPWVLSNVLEHNYMGVDDNDEYVTAGIVLGLSLYSEYSFTADGRTGEVPISSSKQEEEGMAFAEEMVDRLRNGASNKEEDISDVPIVVALFSEQPSNSINAGNFFKVGVFEPSGNVNWDDINQKHLYFPSSVASEEHQNDASRFSQFQADIQSFFDNHVGVVGRARYDDNQLTKLIVDMNIQYKGKAEVVAMTQYAAGRIEEHFENVPVDINISSLSGSLESIVSYHPNTETFIHIIQ